MRITETCPQCGGWIPDIQSFTDDCICPLCFRLVLNPAIVTTLLEGVIPPLERELKC